MIFAKIVKNKWVFQLVFLKKKVWINISCQLRNWRQKFFIRQKGCIRSGSIDKLTCTKLATSFTIHFWPWPCDFYSEINKSVFEDGSPQICTYGIHGMKLKMLLNPFEGWRPTTSEFSQYCLTKQIMFHRVKSFYGIPNFFFFLVRWDSIYFTKFTVKQLWE